MPVAIGAGRKAVRGARAAAADSSCGGGGVNRGEDGDGVGYMQMMGHAGRGEEDSDASSASVGKRDSYGSYSDSSKSSGSGGESPRSMDSAVAFAQKAPLCRCRRGLAVMKHERCWMCLRDAGWRP